MSAPTALDSPPAAPLGAVGWLRFLWRRLTSMSTALVLLFLLALAAVPGSVFPQRSVNPLQVKAYLEANPTLGPVLDRLGMFDVFAAPWFAAVYLLLFVSLVGCVVPRLVSYAKALRTPPPPAPRVLSRLQQPHLLTAAMPAEQAAPRVLAAARAQLARRRWRLRDGTDAAGGGAWLAAEKGYLREAGNLLFHTALLVILLGVSWGALWGWKGNVIVREGDGFANLLTQYDAWGGGRLADPSRLVPFSFTLDRFTADFERGEAQHGAPRVFEADVTYRAEPGGAERSQTIEVNEPLQVDGAKVFLVGHGYAVHVRIVGADGKVTFDDAVPFLPQDGNFTSTGVVKAYDADPGIGLQGIFLPTAALDAVRGPYSTFPAADDPAVFFSAWRGDLGIDDGVPQSVYTLKTDAMQQVGLRALRPGESWQLPDGLGTVEFVGVTRWASFSIAYDPGKQLALAAAATAIGGLCLSLFVRRRRLWVRVRDDAEGATVIEVAGLARSEQAGLADEVGDVVRAVSAAVTAVPRASVVPKEN